MRLSGPSGLRRGPKRAAGIRLLVAVSLLAPVFAVRSTGTALAAFDQTAQFITAPAPAMDISCPSTTTCYVVSETGGEFQPDQPAGVLTPLTIASNGTITSGASAPPGRPFADVTRPFVHHNRLFGVDCVSADVCYTVGMAYIRNEGTLSDPLWGERGSVNPFVRDQAGVVTGWDIHWIDSTLGLDDIDCPSPTLCFAVGGTASEARTVAIHVNGNDSTPGDWNTVAGSARLTNIDCPTITTCYAVGINNGYDRQGVYVALSTAAMDSANKAPIATAQGLSGTTAMWTIDCPTTIACYGAGKNASSGVMAGFTTSGSIIAATSVQAVPGSSVFNRISCANANTCYAVGKGPNGAVIAQYALLNPTVQGVLAIADLSSIDCVGNTCYAVGTNGITGQSVVVTITPPPTNVALNTLALSSHLPCTLGSGPENAVDGAASNIYTDKWCVPSGTPTLTIQLPASAYGFTLSKIVVKHAGVAGESPTWNTRAYKLRVRKGAISGICAPSTVATVTNNTANQTVHAISSKNVSQVQLVVDLPTQGTNQATRIYEVEVWGTPSTTLSLFCF